MTATGGAPSRSSASVISRPIQGCTPKILKKLPDTSSPLRVSACAPDPALRTPSGALPACNAARSVNSGVCTRKFLYASQENSEKSPSSSCVYPPQLQQRTLSPILHNCSGFVTGSDFSITWCTSVKIAVAAPIPGASVLTPVAVPPGSFRSWRSAARKSACPNPPILSAHSKSYLPVRSVFSVVPENSCASASYRLDTRQIGISLQISDVASAAERWVEEFIGKYERASSWLARG